MAEEKKSIFRKKAIDRISSPEQMDDYLQVTGPSTWIILIAIVFLVLGFLTWGIFGKLETTMDVAIVSDDGLVECYIPYDRMEKISKNDKNARIIKISNKEYEFYNNGKAVDIVTKDTDDSIMLVGNLEPGDKVQPMVVKADLRQGIYTGKIVIETVSPIHYILN